MHSEISGYGKTSANVLDSLQTQTNDCERTLETRQMSNPKSQEKF